MKDEQIHQLEQLAARLDNSGIAEYLKLSRNTPRILWLNFISGIARGLGFTVGTAIVLAIAYRVISEVISMNIPYLTELLQQFIHLMKAE